MPHLIIDHSANMAALCDLAALCDHMRRAMIDTGVFPLAGIRVRTHRADHVSIADGNPCHGYIDMTVKIGAGRDEDTRTKASELLFNAARDFLDDVMQTHPVGLSLTLVELPAATSHKANTIRDFLAKGTT